MNEFQIVSYGIQISTLEEVFLKVGHLEDPQLAQVKPVINKNMLVGETCSALTDTKSQEGLDSEEFSLQHSRLDESVLSGILAIVSRRLNSYRRNKKLLLWEVFLPVLLFVLGVLLSHSLPDPRAESRFQEPSRL